jgi:mono/diheme cytochrome c family protein
MRRAAWAFSIRGLIVLRTVSPLTLLVLGIASAGCASKPTATGPEGLYLENCARCHARAGEPGGPSLGGSKGPDLSHIGSAKGMTVEWLTSYIRDPKSVRPDAKMMPAFGDKLSEEQIRSLAEYLAARK